MVCQTGFFFCQDAVQFVSYEELDSQFAQKVLEYLAGLGDVISCGLVRACQIAFPINLTVLSCTAGHAQVILLISLDTL